MIRQYVHGAYSIASRLLQSHDHTITRTSDYIVNGTGSTVPGMHCRRMNHIPVNHSTVVLFISFKCSARRRVTLDFGLKVFIYVYAFCVLTYKNRLYC